MKIYSAEEETVNLDDFPFDELFDVIKKHERIKANRICRAGKLKVDYNPVITKFLNDRGYEGPVVRYDIINILEKLNIFGYTRKTSKLP